MRWLGFAAFVVLAAAVLLVLYDAQRVPPPTLDEARQAIEFRATSLP